MQPYVGLTLLAALLFAAGNALQKDAIASRLPRLTAGAVARQPLRLAAAIVREPRWAVGLAVTLLAVGLETQALSLGDLSVVKPLSRVQSIFVVAIGVCILGERLSTAEWVGIAILAAGVGVLALEPGRSAATTSARGAMLLASAAVALATSLLLVVADRVPVHGAREIVPAAASGALFGMSDVVMKVSTELVRERIGHFELPQWATVEALLVNPEFHLAIALAAAAFLVQQFAFSRGRVSVVAPIIGVGATAVAVVVGSALLSEPLGALRAVGIAAVLSGTFFLGRTDAPPVPARTSAVVEDHGGGTSHSVPRRR